MRDTNNSTENKIFISRVELSIASHINNIANSLKMRLMLTSKIIIYCSKILYEKCFVPVQVLYGLSFVVEWQACPSGVLPFLQMSLNLAFRYVHILCIILRIYAILSVNFMIMVNSMRNLCDWNEL